MPLTSLERTEPRSAKAGALALCKFPYGAAVQGSTSSGDFRKPGWLSEWTSRRRTDAKDRKLEKKNFLAKLGMNDFFNH